MAITLAELLDSPAGEIHTLAGIQVIRNTSDTVLDDWTIDGGHTNTYFFPWPWVEGSAEHPVEPDGVNEWVESAETWTSLTDATSLANCDATDGSWWWDEPTGRVYVNPTGAITGKLYDILYTLRLTSDGDRAFDIGGGDFRYYAGNITRQPTWEQALSLRSGIEQRSRGSIQIHADGIDLETRFREEIFNGQQIVIKIWGRERQGAVIEELAFADSHVLVTGIVQAGDGFGQLNLDTSNREMVLPFTDRSVTESAIVPKNNTPFTGTPAEIADAAFTAAGLDAAPFNLTLTIRSGVTTNRTEHGEFPRESERRFVDILQACLRHGLVAFWDSAGDLIIDEWKGPAGSASATFEQNEAEIFGVTEELDYSLWQSEVQVQLYTGGFGVTRIQDRAGSFDVDRDMDDEEKEPIWEETQGGWTAVGGTFTNSYFRVFGKGAVVAVYEKPDDSPSAFGTFRPLSEQGTLAGVDGDNLSFAWLPKDDVSSGQAMRLYINPGRGPSGFQIDPNDATVQYRIGWRIKKDRKVESGSGAKDVSMVSSVDAATADAQHRAAILNRERVHTLNSLITNKTGAQSLADDLIELMKNPLHKFALNSGLAKALQVELNDTIQLNHPDGTNTKLVMERFRFDIAAKSYELKAWEFHEGTAI